MRGDLARPLQHSTLDCPMTLSPDTPAKSAFSLVEVTLAVGIIGFGLVIVMALMPVGLSTLREAMDGTTEAQIIRKISGEALLTPFSQLPVKYEDQIRYYDDAGLEEVTQSSRTRYAVTTKLRDASYPGSAAVPSNSPLSDNLKTLQLDVAIVPASGNSNQKRTYNIRIPNSGG